MIVPDNLFALPETAALLRTELARVGAQAARRPGGRALVMQACAVNRSLPVDTRHLAALRVHVLGRRFDGDVACAADALPWHDDAFELVVVQHVCDVLGPMQPLFDELARVLAPGAVLLWYGLNPLSPWQVRARWRSPRGMPLPRAHSAGSVRRCLSGRDLTTGPVDYLSADGPESGTAAARPALRLPAPLRCAYAVTACSKRAVLTPLRPAVARKHAMAQPLLAGAQSRRARA